MNILVDAHPHYNYMDATVVQGLRNLGHAVFGLGGNGNNYCIPHRGEPYELFIQCIVGGFLGKTGVPNVALWGEDSGLGSAQPGIDFNGNFDAAFVRDLRLDLSEQKIFPINFGIENRYYCQDEDRLLPLWRRPTDIFFLGHISTAMRTALVNLCESKFKNKECMVGPRRFNGNEPPWSQWTNVWCGHDSQYFNAMAQSKIAISLMGLGPDTARTWEILASGAVLVMEEYPAIMCPPPLVHGKHLFKFKTIEELYLIITEILEDPLRFQDMADLAYHAGKRSHTTTARAKYILRTLEELRLIPENNA